VSGGQSRPSLASYRDAVAERIRAGQSFGDLEDDIEKLAALTVDQKAALWLFAFALRDSSEQQRGSRADLTADE
jgi:hypothetical protein